MPSRSCRASKHEIPVIGIPVSPGRHECLLVACLSRRLQPLLARGAREMELVWRASLDPSFSQWSPHVLR